jgi:5'-methylthioadenosine phosphorylase
MKNIKIAVIGGSGLYKLDRFNLLETIYPETPWGFPSAAINVCEYNGQKVAFLSRHGEGHSFIPSGIPFRANIASLKSLGVEIILSFSAVGSLREEIRPKDFVLPSQVIDRTCRREMSFFENNCVGHMGFADPFNEELCEIISSVSSSFKIHRNKTLVVIEGPAFSTRAESHLYRSWGCDVINMTTLPEAKLAREAGISYQVICMATDYGIFSR